MVDTAATSTPQETFQHLLGSVLVDVLLHHNFGCNAPLEWNSSVIYVTLPIRILKIVLRYNDVFALLAQDADEDSPTAAWHINTRSGIEALTYACVAPIHRNKIAGAKLSNIRWNFLLFQQNTNHP